MKFTLEIELGNDAVDINSEVVKILFYESERLRNVVSPLTLGDTSGVINGNTVGKWEVTA